MFLCADCYKTGASDNRIVGYEARGCGSGPTSIPTEPGEGCEYITKKDNDNKDFELFNCVCDKNTCNAATVLKRCARPLSLYPYSPFHLILWFPGAGFGSGSGSGSGSTTMTFVIPLTYY